MGFVDGNEGGLALGEHGGEAGDAHAFGGDEEEVEVAGEVVAAGLAGVVAGEAGVNAGDAEAEGGELGGLVVHEGDEGGDDEGGAAAREGGELVAEGLSGAGGHDEQDVAAGGGGFADELLVGAEVAVAEDAVEEVGEGFGLGGDARHGMRLCSHIVCLGKAGSWEWKGCGGKFTSRRLAERTTSCGGLLYRDAPDAWSTGQH